jgi:hypothetical protein
MTSLLTQALCLFLLWPAMLVRFGGYTPAPRRVRRRQWAAVGMIGNRTVAIRLQVIAI